jgi:hypothetical protein
MREMPLVEGKLIGKYRRLLIPFGALADEAAALRPALNELQAAHRDGKITDASLAQQFIALFAARRTQKILPPFPGMPGMIDTILSAWQSAAVNLRLSPCPVSSLEMLRAQAEGWRYVTISFEHALAGDPIEGSRDALEFALHDLGHAYAFFKADYQPHGQQAFFAALLSDLTLLAPLAESDTKFAADLEYCMADMNSHPQHLGQYLQGVIVEAYLRKPQYDEAELQQLLDNLHCLKELRRKLPQSA